VADFNEAGRYVLADAAIPAALLDGPLSGALVRRDIVVEDGMIKAIEPPRSHGPQEAVHDCDGGLVLPCFADIHTHLDKGHIWPRRPNPDGTWMNALLSVAADREANWSAPDVERRMDFSLRTAFAHGTAAIRTHLDSAPPQHDVTWDVFEAVRARWQGRIELQGVSLIGPDHLLDRHVLKVVAERTRAAGGILGGAIADHPESRTAMFNVVETAGEFGLDLDIHCDETGNPEASSLRHLADAVIECGYAGRILAGHCCALSIQDERTRRETIARVAEAGIAVVSLPMCNMYLQDRRNDGKVTTPRWRGVAPLHELAAAGVAVAIASDNTRDPFYAYGDLDGMEVLREGARILHFDHPQEQAWIWARSMLAGAAYIAGFDHHAVLAVGSPADLVLVRARNWSELMARPQSDRIVLRKGAAIDRSLPDYRELDDLMGVA
jgi:cytosine/creatinine deaminase